LAPLIDGCQQHNTTTTTTMKINTSLVFAAIPISSFVDADAFVTSPQHAFHTHKLSSSHAKTPVTPASRLNDNPRALAAPWSNTALEMSGGGGGETVSTEGTATIPDEIFNLVKSIVGAGVLSLPAGACLS
jgi:hypothetical protein